MRVQRDEPATTFAPQSFFKNWYYSGRIVSRYVPTVDSRSVAV